MKNKIEHIKLKSLGRNNPFSVPEGYFDTFPKIVMERIDSGSLPKRRTVGQVLKPVLWLAASFIIILSVIGVAVKYVESWDKNSTDPVAIVLEENESSIYYLNDWMLYNILDDENGDEMISDATMEEVLLASVSVYDLID
ncbi:MAG: hypothetical protein JW798_10115 [Prolixibacteraceae bacterium]|nr:hypothetical protein [Prolixibacteraceae bacterium]